MYFLVLGMKLAAWVMGKAEAFASSASAGPKSSAGYGDSARCFTIAALLSLLVFKQAGENLWKYK